MIKYKRLVRMHQHSHKSYQIIQKGDFEQMASINLTQNKIALIDEEDLERVNKHKWSYRKNYGKQSHLQGYAQACIKIENKWKSVYLHRFIMNAKQGEKIDHENGNSLDCRKINLRLASTTQNNRNNRVRKDNGTGFKGVTFHRASNKYNARIRTGSKQEHLGLYENPIDAALAYDEAARKLHGEFATLNFPETGERNCLTG